MAMDLYNNSPAARAIWDRADAHLLATYGFSINEIVRDNPKDKTIYFSGIQDQAIRQHYMDMAYDILDKDGHVSALPLFADINSRTPRFTFSHRNGLLFAPQFAQIALVVTEESAFEDMYAKGFVQKDCAFAGHSWVNTLLLLLLLMSSTFLLSLMSSPVVVSLCSVLSSETLRTVRIMLYVL
jgi:fatty acid synthase subunit alpha